MEEAKALRSGPVGRSPHRVAQTIRAFLAAAKERKPLLDDAGINEAKLARLEKDLAQLGEVSLLKEKKQQDKDETGSEITSAALTLESAFHFFRANAISALEDDERALESAFGYLPRAPDRRRRAAAPGGGPVSAPTAGQATEKK